MHSLPSEKRTNIDGAQQKKENATGRASSESPEVWPLDRELQRLFPFGFVSFTSTA